MHPIKLICGIFALCAGTLLSALTLAQTTATVPAAATSKPATHSASGPATSALQQKASLEMARLKLAIDAFFIDIGRFPTTAEGFAVLFQAPNDLKDRWKGPYLQATPKDPWGHPYLYVYPAGKNGDIFQLSCAGPDGIPATADDFLAP